MIAAAVAAIMVPSAILAAQAGAAVQPTGSVTLKITLTLNETITGTPTAIGPLAGTAKGTVDAAGHLNFPKGKISFPPFATTTAGQDVILHVVPDADWTGSIDPASKTVLLNATASVDFSVAVLSVVDCPLGPSTWGLFGTNYNSTTGKVNVTDPSFDIPALVPGANAGCNGQENTVNGLLPLPATASAKALLTFSPVISGVGTKATTTTAAPTTTTTTVAPATTAAPVTSAANPVGGNQLPRTGSATMPLAFVGGAFVLSGLALVVRRRPRTT